MEEIAVKSGIPIIKCRRENAVGVVCVPERKRLFISSRVTMRQGHPCVGRLPMLHRGLDGFAIVALGFDRKKVRHIRPEDHPRVTRLLGISTALEFA